MLAVHAGQVRPVQKGALAGIGLEGIDGTPVGRARLGQQKGMRALRLSQDEAAGGTQGPGQGSAMLAEGPGAPMADLPAVADPFAQFAAPMDLDGGLLAAG